MEKTLGELMESLRESPKVEKWEYLEESWNSRYSKVDNFINWLNELGKEGWELVDIIKASLGWCKCIFKRKIQPG